jgi:hypothetical protein
MVAPVIATITHWDRGGLPSLLLGSQIKKRNYSKKLKKETERRNEKYERKGTWH